MKTKNAVFDLDDTLLDFKTQIMNSLESEYDQYVHWNNWTGYNLLEIYDLTPEQLRDAWIKHECLETATPLLYSRQVLLKAKEMGLNVVLVSARSWHPEGRDLTEAWLKTYDMPYDDLIITTPGDNKVDSLSDYDEFEFGIDDHFHNCKDFSDSDKFNKTFMVHAPWNRSECLEQHDIERLYCLNDLLKMMERGI